MKTLKELYKIPRYNALIRLSGWIIFFSIIFILPKINQNEIKEEISTKTYSEKKEELGLDLNIEYIKNENFILKGIIINDIFTGEVNNTKIEIKDNIIYENKNSELKEKEELKANINTSYLFPKEILTILKDKHSKIKKEANNIKYIYEIEEKVYTIFTDEEMIYKITITEENNNYQINISKR